ncbi:MAG: hypothetical protein OEM52_06080, partial [bacterium]|nr:hypothetical protein [bacterium]
MFPKILRNAATLPVSLFLLVTSIIIPQFTFAFTGNTPGFVENRGQWNSRVNFMANSENGIRWWFTSTGPVVEVISATVTNSEATTPENIDPEYPSGVINGHVFPIRFLNESNEVIRGVPLGESPQITVSNYLLGSDKSKWAPGCRHFDRVVYKNVWQGIDVVYRWEENRVKVEYVVAEHASPESIKLGYESLLLPPSVDIASGDLLLQTSLGVVRELLPYAYQIETGRQIPLPTHYSLDADGFVTFTFPNGYDNTLPLVIDPLAFGTYLGGNVLDQIQSMCTNSNAHYVCGYTSSTTFPVTVGAYQNTFDGGTYDAFYAKMARDGYSLYFCTYIGGASTDAAYSISEANNQGETFIAGETQSSDFLPGTTEGWDIVHNGGYDQFLVRLNSNGSAIVNGTYIGGSSNDRCWAMAVTDAKEPYIIGWSNSSNYPTSSNAYRQSNSGSWDAIIAMFDSSLTNRIASTYLGGTQDEKGYGIALGTQGVYVIGTAVSANFPVTTSGYQRTYGGTGPYGGGDAFVSILAGDLSSLTYSTFLGGSSDDYGRAILPTTDGFIITGYTFSTNFPVSSNAAQIANHGSNDCFLAKFTNQGSNLFYSTYFGGTGADYAMTIAPYNGVSVWIAGNTFGNNYPITNNCHQNASRGISDGILSLMAVDSGAVPYSSYLGGTGNDFISDITNYDGNLAFAGYSSSTSLSFPGFGF